MAETLAPVLADNVAEGAHVYVAAPLAVRPVDAPLHIPTSGLPLTVGNGLTDTFTVAELTQPFTSVPVTV